MYQPFDLSGQGVVITGGNGGIGYGMARALLASGAKVAIWGSNVEKTGRAQASLAQECGDASRVHGFVCDVGDEAQVEEVFAESVRALGRVVTMRLAARDAFQRAAIGAHDAERDHQLGSEDVVG